MIEGFISILLLIVGLWIAFIVLGGIIGFIGVAIGSIGDLCDDVGRELAEFSKPLRRLIRAAWLCYVWRPLATWFCRVILAPIDRFILAPISRFYDRVTAPFRRLKASIASVWSRLNTFAKTYD